MKEKYFINARIIDPSQKLDEVGGLIVDAKGKIKAVGKNVKKGNIPVKSDKIDLKGKSVPFRGERVIDKCTSQCEKIEKCTFQ